MTNIKTTRYAFTLKGALYAEAILNGCKRIENRHFKIKPGYYFLHVGKGNLSKEREDYIHSISHLEKTEKDLIKYKTKIVGIVHVKKHFKFSEDVNDPWASGPICNEIDEVYKFQVPVFAKGHLSIWDLSAQPDAFLKAHAEIVKLV